MDVREHFYSDDPRVGPADVRTTLKGVEYFFLGNGHLQAAIQLCSAADGTPLGLLLMHPERLGNKRQALTFDPKLGLQPTMVGLVYDGASFYPAAGGVSGGWSEIDGVPAVRLEWSTGDFSVRETFLFPDRQTPRLARRIAVRNLSGKYPELVLKTQSREINLQKRIELAAGQEKETALVYELIGREEPFQLAVGWATENEAPLPSAVAYWEQASWAHFNLELLDHLFRVATVQLPAVVSASGVMDGSVWQYNREWARDQALVATALTMAGHAELARTVIRRLFTQFVTDAGDTIDSSQVRSAADVELDQNGFLLKALLTYCEWTGDEDLPRQLWDKIRVTADFPLQEAFFHAESGLLHNSREFWERHAGHGIQDGFELMHQCWTVIGLECAATLASHLGREEEAQRWQQQRELLKRAMLDDSRYALQENGSLIKRRKIDGQVQKDIRVPAGIELPSGVPLLEAGLHYLDPDSSSALPIAWELVEPYSPLAWRTLERLEPLWNQRWDIGGYGRYHVTSEPDSPGPWPFASLFIARAYFEAGDEKRAWRVLRWLNGLPGSRAGSWFEFYGPRPMPPYPQVGIVPWTWAEIIFFFIHHVLGVRPMLDGLWLRPRRLKGLKSVEASLPLRQQRLHLSLRRLRGAEKAGFIVAGEFFPFRHEGLVLPYPDKELQVQAILP